MGGLQMCPFDIEDIGCVLYEQALVQLLKSSVVKESHCQSIL